MFDMFDYRGDMFDHWGDVFDHWGNMFDFGDGQGDGVDIRAGPLDDGVEAADRVGGVLDEADVSVGLHQRVGALHHVAVPRLPLCFVVAGMRVVHGIVKRVSGVGL